MKIGLPIFTLNTAKNNGVKFILGMVSDLRK